MTGDLSAAGRGLGSQAAQYERTDDPVLPVVELIATVAHPEPGPDGMYRSRSSDALVDMYLAQARRSKGLLLLNIQPGRASFSDEVRAYAHWLAEPDVGVALDPEWAMGPGEVPGQRFGSTTGAELNAVSAYLSGLVAQHRLPQKVMAYHQVASSVVSSEEALLPQRGVAPVKSVDGIGAPGVKLETWTRLMRDKPVHVVPGFKLFYDEDVQRGGVLMTPEQVMALQPSPGYVMYE